jgi:hypothetical protein
MKTQTAPSPKTVTVPLLATYWQQSRRPLASLAFVLPLLLFYEAGVIFLGTQAVRNGADVWLRQVLDQLGFGQYFLLPALTIGVLLAWHHVSRERWQLSATVLYTMFGECAVLALGLLIIGRLEGRLAQVLAGAPTADPWTTAIVWFAASRAALLGRVLGFLGAGIYEEMLFRLLLLPPVGLCADRLGANGAWRIVTAVLLTSLVFSAAHYVGPQGEMFQAMSFWFRFTAGAVFAVLFVYRGFGIAAGTHALYDIFVSFG